MRCERCGRLITNGEGIRTMGGVTLCNQCARSLGYYRGPSDFMDSTFAQLDEIASSIMKMSMSDIDFGNSTLTCPKCGMTLREFDHDGTVGCIECYNTFNSNIVREMLKLQGNKEYAGRQPAKIADTDIESEAVPPVKKARKQMPGPDNSLPVMQIEPGQDNEGPDKSFEEKKSPAEQKKKGLSVDQLKKADLGMLSDEDLENGIKAAAEAEEYVLASKLRDELKGRKEGENNG